MKFTLPYGTSTLEFNLAWSADVADLSQAMGIPVDKMGPLQHEPLDVAGYDQAIIIFTDATRHSPDQWFAQHLLNALPLPPERIRFMCALGMHRPSTDAEKIAKLGQDIVLRHEVLDHDPASVITIGELDGVPIQINPILREMGMLILCTGVVEPHQYAGYSGGSKTAVIGCGGPDTIAYTHGPAMLDQDGVRLGIIQNNPFQDYIRRAGKLIGVKYVINAVMPTDDHIAAAALGEPTLVHDMLVASARSLYEVTVPNAPYDLVIAGAGAPKDANLYQASRAATYIGLSGTPVLRQGGVIILPAELPEGAGEGAGERNFYQILQRFGPTPALIEYLRREGCKPGEQRAYMIAQLLAQYRCIIVGAKTPAIVQGAGFLAAPDMPHALRLAQELLNTPNPKTLIVPHAIKVLPKP